MEYKFINVCRKVYIKYKGVYVDLQECPKCGLPKHKQVGHNQILAKVLCHFSNHIVGVTILFFTCHIKLLVWHHENKSKDGLVRHMVNSNVWKHVDKM